MMPTPPSKATSMAKERVVKRKLADGTVREYRYTTKKTVGSVTVEYRQSSEWADLAGSTRKAYEVYLDMIGTAFWDVDIAAVELGHVLRMRDAHRDQPATANKLFAIWSILLSFSMRRGYIKHHPMVGARVRKLKEGEHARWPEGCVDLAIEVLPQHLARAVMLAVYTGQRVGDCIARRWSDLDDGGMRLIQQKTGAELWVPLHPELEAALKVWRREAVCLTILTKADGMPWASTDSFKSAFTAAKKKHPELNGLVFHGLRKSAAARLAEAGCSEHEIMAITGHRSLAEVQRYTRQARQKTMAMSAMVKLSDYTKKR